MISTRALPRFFVVGLLTLAQLISNAGFAEEVPEGTVVDASNLDQMKGMTLDGHRIGDMIYERIEDQIRNDNLKLHLKRHQPLPIDPDFTKWNSVNAQSVKYDPTTRRIKGWQAGMPFPIDTIDIKDPQCGDKVMWNVFYGSLVGTDIYAPDYPYLLIDGAKGLDRQQNWQFYRIFHKGRWGDPNGTEIGDQAIYHKTLLFATEPFDIKGLGFFTIKYDSPRLEDSWAYIRSFRRVRRLSGGAWTDPIAGTDLLIDDIEIFNAYPTWYPQYRCVDKRYILATNNSRPTHWVKDAKTEAERYPCLDLSGPPFWNPIDDWEPVEVITVEAITPPEHPYSKKVLYYGTEYPRIYQGEAYDRKGDFWKFFNYQLGARRGADGKMTVWSRQGHVIDFQRNHATVVIWPDSVIFRHGLKPDDVTLGVLEAAAGR